MGESGKRTTILRVERILPTVPSGIFPGAFAAFEARSSKILLQTRGVQLISGPLLSSLPTQLLKKTRFLGRAILPPEPPM